MTGVMNLIRIERFPLLRISEWLEKDAVLRDGEFICTQPADSDVPGSLGFCETASYAKAINGNPCITCVIAPETLVPELDARLGVAVSSRPRLDFFRLHNRLAGEAVVGPPFTPQVASDAVIHPAAFVDREAFVASGVAIGPGAMVLSNVYIDEGAVIGPNAVIGAEGLEAQFEEDQSLLRIAHVGGTYIGPGVSIMSNSVVSRDVYHGFTRVGAGTMVGPLCNIGHRSSIGEGVRIAGNATIGGSAVIGDKAWIGPSATISNGVTVGNGARVSLGSVVVKAVKPGRRVSGRFAVAHADALREYARIRGRGS